MTNIVKSLAITGTLLILLIQPVAAGSSNSEFNDSRTIRGVVTDTDRRALSGAVVRIKNTRTLMIRSYITGSDGRYHFSSVRGDVEDEVWATHDHQTSDKARVSQFNESPTITLNLVVCCEKGGE